MNYFTLFSLPISFQPDRAAVKASYYALSRRYHPDFHNTASEEEKEEILEKSSQVNNAYKVFSNPDATIKYVLQLKGLLEEEEKYQLSPEFLMEVMELNEQVMEMDSQDTEAKQALERNIAALQEEILGPVRSILQAYKDGETSEQALLQVKEYYFRKKYLDRILEGLG